MYALRERRQHVTQEDFEFAIAKVRGACFREGWWTDQPACIPGIETEPGFQHVGQQAVQLSILCACWPVVLGTTSVGQWETGYY